MVNMVSAIGRDPVLIGWEIKNYWKISRKETRDLFRGKTYRGHPARVIERLRRGGGESDKEREIYSRSRN